MSTARTRQLDRSPPTEDGSNGRLAELDGLRGWSSLSVVLSHLIFGVFANAEPHLVNQTIKNLLEPFLGGTFDVCVFFVLSGDALSSSHWRAPFKRDFVARFVTRYVRLAVPICVASFAVFLLVKCELVYFKEAGALLNSGEWLGSIPPRQLHACECYVIFFCQCILASGPPYRSHSIPVDHENRVVRIVSNNMLSLC